MSHRPSRIGRLARLPGVFRDLLRRWPGAAFSSWSDASAGIVLDILPGAGPVVIHLLLAPDPVHPEKARIKERLMHQSADGAAPTLHYPDRGR